MISYKMMKEAHIPAVARLERDNFSMPWSENVLQMELNNPLSLWLVAIDDGQVIGYVGSQIVPDEADMMNLAVCDAYRRQGVGHGLVCALLSALKARGVRSLTLEVRVSNAPACALYESLGFMVVGRRPSYYQKPKEDALILRKEWQN
ncbi:MAG: ribosomal-protein-alanine N-acetyltransferase [Ruminococcaceae bacterium]|nr:ribosomal-protein-alanine N-acetyltransferase [Oscillospiraceae bacterium]